MPWKVIAPVAAVVLLLVLLPLLFAGQHRDTNVESAPPPASPPAAQTNPPEPEPVPKPKDQALITLEEFENLRTGMTYNQILDIVGDLETETRQIYDEGVAGYTSPSLTVWYVWKNPDGSWARVALISDKLRRKEQEGLEALQAN